MLDLAKDCMIRQSLSAGVPPAVLEVPPGVPPAASEVPPGVPPAASEVPPGVPPSRHLREARHNRNRLQANIVSAAGGKTAPVTAPEGRHCLKGNTIQHSAFFSVP